MIAFKAWFPENSLNVSSPVDEIQTSNPLSVGPIGENGLTPTPIVAETTSSESPSRFTSWTFRSAAWIGSATRFCFGIASLLVLLAVVAAIPVLQFASFGYLLAVSGRVAKQGRLRAGFIGVEKAVRLGGVLLGVWLSIVPVRLLSESWYAAWLIDPASASTRVLRILLISGLLLTVLHLLSALACGGRLRHFLWPLWAPFRWALWAVQGSLGWRPIGALAGASIGLVMPCALADFRSLKPLQNWFPPSVLRRSFREGQWMRRSSEQLWQFWLGLRLPYFWWLGVRGAAGTLLWLLFPSGLLIAAANRNDPGGGLLALIGIPLAALVFALLIQVQLRFSVTERWRTFLEPRAGWTQFRRAPLWSALAGWVALVLALPMFLLKIEAVPPELHWVLSLVFVAGAWPSRLLLGASTASGLKRASGSSWWWSLLWAFVLVIGCGAFAVILVLTRYLSWSGAGSLLENHLFLLPTPFWLN